MLAIFPLEMIQSGMHAQWQIKASSKSFHYQLNQWNMQSVIFQKLMRPEKLCEKECVRGSLHYTQNFKIWKWKVICLYQLNYSCRIFKNPHFFSHLSIIILCPMHLVVPLQLWNEVMNLLIVSAVFMDPVSSSTSKNSTKYS